MITSNTLDAMSQSKAHLTMYKLFTGDCLEVLKQFQDNSIDGCITDPPYGMGMEEWDHSVPTKEIWEDYH